jgi:A/G-specific adenine glycosylase
MWRGSGPDPAVASAAVSTPQGAFVGSERQVRGRIVDMLRAGPIRIAELTRLGRPHDAEHDLERIVGGLVRDGLAERSGDVIRLPA